MKTDENLFKQNRNRRKLLKSMKTNENIIEFKEHDEQSMIIYYNITEIKENYENQRKSIITQI